MEKLESRENLQQIEVMVDTVDKRPPIIMPFTEEVSTQTVETRKSTLLCKDSDGTVYVSGEQGELERQVERYKELTAGQFPDGFLPKIFKLSLWRGRNVVIAEDLGMGGASLFEIEQLESGTLHDCGERVIAALNMQLPQLEEVITRSIPDGVVIGAKAYRVVVNEHKDPPARMLIYDFGSVNQTPSSGYIEQSDVLNQNSMQIYRLANAINGVK